jgi:two-component system cell cycle sensor histidine kinase PleC
VKNNQNVAPKISEMLTLGRIYSLIEIFCILVFAFYFFHLHSGQMAIHKISLNESNKHIETAFYKSISNSEIIIKYVADLILHGDTNKEKLNNYIAIFNAQSPFHSLLKRSPLQWIERPELLEFQHIFTHLNLAGFKSATFANERHITLQFGALKEEKDRSYLPIFYCVTYKDTQCNGGLYTEFDFSGFTQVLSKTHGDYYDSLQFTIFTEFGEIVAESADKYISTYRRNLLQDYLKAREKNDDFRGYMSVSPLAAFSLGESVKIKKIKGYPYYIATVLPNQFNYQHNISLHDLFSRNLFVLFGIGIICLIFSLLTRLFLLKPILEVSKLAADVVNGTKDVYIKNYQTVELQNIAHSLQKIIVQKYELIEARAHQDYVIKQLETASTAKSSFIRRIQHVLRTPLNHIIGGADIIAKQLSSGKEISVEYVHIIAHAGKELLNTINNIITATDVEAGSIRLEENYVELRDVINNAMFSIHPQALHNNIKLDVHVEHGLPQIFIDVAKFTIVLQNLLRNAITYNRIGGSVQLTAKYVAKGIVIKIKDNGRGMSANEINNISSQDSSYNLLNNTSGGLGLGLAIVHSIVNLHDMKLEINSKEGDGTEVSLTIPNIRLMHGRQ